MGVNRINQQNSEYSGGLSKISRRKKTAHMSRTIRNQEDILLTPQDELAIQKAVPGITPDGILGYMLEPLEITRCRYMMLMAPGLHDSDPIVQNNRNKHDKDLRDLAGSKRVLQELA